MLSIDRARFGLRILVPLFIAVFSFFVLSKLVPQTHMINVSMERLEESEKTVEKFAVASISTSVAITFLPDDIGSSIADSLAELNKYFIVILVVIYIEKLMLVYGTGIAFKIIIPLACAVYIASCFVKKDLLRSIAIKIGILALAVMLLIPCGTKVSDVVCASYMEYVNEIIDETESKSKTITEIITSVDEEQSVLEKISEAFKSAVTSVNDMITYFKGVVKKCMSAVAILVVATCVVPVVTLVIFVWVLKQLFNISWNPTPIVRNYFGNSSGVSD